METWTDFDLTLNVDDILRGEGMDPATARAKRPALIKAATEAAQVGPGKIKPAAAIVEAKVLEHRHERIRLEGGFDLTGPLTARHLAGADRIAAVVCTIGPELEAFAARQEDMILALALDGLGNAAVTLVGQQVCERIAGWSQADGLMMSTPLSPGAPEWPVEVGQPQIFALTDPAAAGVHLTEGGMMIPKKSVSFVVGIGKNISQVNPCEVCNLKETCRYRTV
jgi:hypothetical protein